MFTTPTYILHLLTVNPSFILCLHAETTIVAVLTYAALLLRDINNSYCLYRMKENALIKATWCCVE